MELCCGEAGTDGEPILFRLVVLVKLTLRARLWNVARDVDAALSL